ncbi:MAG: hypothetical protein HXY28_07925 [Hydrogenophilaceae bacterium]|nr:hypothetical protein [Hydrogenophilaceae bacterium]
MMDQKRFAAIVAAYGADPRRWPDAERADAQTFAAAHAEASAPLLAQARALDQALEGAPIHAPSDLLTARVMAAHRAGLRAGLIHGPRRAALSLAACAAMGVLIGFGGARLAPVASPSDGAEEMLAAVFGGGEDPFALLGVGG